MELIMAAKLIVRKEHLESEVHYTYNNSSSKVNLKDATQEQLAILKELGIDIFEKDKKEQ
jgi:hypothetical protein